MRKQLNYIDLFAGAGGLSEGFIKAGYNPIAHVEMDEAACFTLRTRTAYHYLKGKRKFDEYLKYLKGQIDRATLYSLIPENEMNSVINLSLSDENNTEIEVRYLVVKNAFVTSFYDYRNDKLVDNLIEKINQQLKK